MQQAIPYKSWLPPPHATNRSTLDHTPMLGQKSGDNVVGSHLGEQPPKGSSGNTTNMVSENAIIVFARRGCCMGHVVKRLLLSLGVNPPVYEIDEADESSVLQELERIIVNTKAGAGGNDSSVQFPAVFIGGRLFGGLDRLMATHISGELVPILKEAGALWL
uniref:Glutaredoxin domain-containing protein n=1 Tax=Rhizophora mucronata TaxID=61149 RepID=A0A2P2IRW4_RHIMU